MNEINTNWIKELVRSEEQMEQAGLVDFSPITDTQNIILSASIEFLKELKTMFIQSANVFNQMKGKSDGSIRIYGIAKTHADFMLFRNGYKLVFNLVQPGKIQIVFHHMSTPFVSSDSSNLEGESPINDGLLEAAWGAFYEVRWVSDKKPINNEHLIKYYMRKFVQNSAK
jgi:hypothetical protein